MKTKIISDSLSVIINSFGAEVCSVKNKQGVEFIWQADKTVWARHAPVLFPIVGKLKDDFFVYEDQKHELPQHGFARDMEFELIESLPQKCTFQLKSNEQTKKTFPFEFIFQINYQLVENTLATNYKILNPANKPLLFSIGAHPAFNCPLAYGETFNDYYLEFENDAFEITQLNNGLLTDVKKGLKLENKKLFLNKKLFENDALVFENNQINTIRLCSTKSTHSVTLNCKNWPYFGIWTKKGNDQFICLEPWFGIADHEHSTNNLLKKTGIINLAAKAEFNCNFSLIFS